MMQGYFAAGFDPVNSAYGSAFLGVTGYQWLVEGTLLVMLGLAQAWLWLAPADPRGDAVAFNTSLAGYLAPASGGCCGTDVVRMMHDRYAGRWYSTLSFTQTTDIRLPNDSLVHQPWYETAKLPGRLRINRLAQA